nr:hypothetical protein CFP56_74697 [Quercus suber]
MRANILRSCNIFHSCPNAKPRLLFEPSRECFNANNTKPRPPPIVTSRIIGPVAPLLTGPEGVGGLAEDGPALSRVDVMPFVDLLENAGIELILALADDMTDDGWTFVGADAVLLGYGTVVVVSYELLVVDPTSDDTTVAEVPEESVCVTVSQVVESTTVLVESEASGVVETFGVTVVVVSYFTEVVLDWTRSDVADVVC